jgi:phospholipid transport system substrate-binding protein
VVPVIRGTGLVAVLLLLLGTPAHAVQPTERLSTFFKDANRAILAPEGEGGLEERVEAVRVLVNGVIDFEGAARLALGKHWDSRSPAEREEFTRLYADLLERAYLAWLGSKARVGADGVSIRWIGETITGDTATVQTTLLTRAGTEMPIDYHMVRRGDGWAVRDVVIDGLSLAANYHVQIERVIQGGSYADLVARLHEKATPARSDAAVLASAAARAGRAAASAVASLGSEIVDAARIIVEGAPLAELPVPQAVARAEAPAPVELPRPLPVALVTSQPPATTPIPVVMAAPVATARPAAAVVPSERRTFWVQVGAFRTTDAAARVVQRLGSLTATIALNRTSLDALARVLVGPFSERAAAASTLRDLEKRGFTAFIATD